MNNLLEPNAPLARKTTQAMKYSWEIGIVRDADRSREAISWSEDVRLESIGFERDWFGI